MTHLVGPVLLLVGPVLLLVSLVLVVAGVRLLVRDLGPGWWREEG